MFFAFPAPPSCSTVLANMTLKGAAQGFNARLCPKKIGTLLVSNPGGREMFDNKIRPYNATAVEEHDFRYLEFFNSEGEVEAHCFLHVIGDSSGEKMTRCSALRCAGPLGLDVECAGANEDRIGLTFQSGEASQGHCGRCQAAYVFILN